jgi:hypothetical protein
MPFLLCLDIHRQDEGWVPATFVEIGEKTFDLTFEFTHINEADMLTIAKTRWNKPTVDVDKHTLGHETYQARLLAKCLMALTTHDLSFTLLINQVPSKYRNDGIYLFLL